MDVFQVQCPAAYGIAQVLISSDVRNYFRNMPQSCFALLMENATALYMELLRECVPTTYEITQDLCLKSIWNCTGTKYNRNINVLKKKVLAACKAAQILSTSGGFSFLGSKYQYEFLMECVPWLYRIAKGICFNGIWNISVTIYSGLWNCTTFWRLIPSGMWNYATNKSQRYMELIRD
ncbi:hypothetical protein K0M31_012615 [Melipona bicolor]|uniref:Uncharacterized protein n=1 Tax=Melipona bicolor TaxID=60889 RepID=A0AA40FJL6_9HYME|nr:hypothetical protein K0M31_012615 [Melipona bicolor]